LLAKRIFRIENPMISICSGFGSSFELQEFVFIEVSMPCGCSKQQFIIERFGPISSGFEPDYCQFIVSYATLSFLCIFIFG